MENQKNRLSFWTANHLKLRNNRLVHANECCGQSPSLWPEAKRLREIASSAFKPRALKKFQNSTAWSYHSPTASFEDVLLFPNHVGIEEYLVLCAYAKFRSKTLNVLPLCFPRSNCLQSTQDLMHMNAHRGYQLLDRITISMLADPNEVAVLVYQVIFIYSTKSDREDFFCCHQDTIPNMQRLKISPF